MDFTAAERWLDPHLRHTLIAEAVQAGENRIEITGRPPDVRMVLEAVYLLRDFGLHPVEKGFGLVIPTALGFGPWARQGRPFAAASVTYETGVEVPDGASALRVDLGHWRGSLVQVLVDGERAALLGWPPWSADVPVSPGAHRIGVRVAGTPHSVFGPFHDPRPVPRVLWPGHWILFADKKQPPGAEYEVVDYGLFEAPRLSLVSPE